MFYQDDAAIRLDEDFRTSFPVSFQCGLDWLSVLVIYIIVQCLICEHRKRECQRKRLLERIKSCYIATLSMRKLRDDCGNSYYGIDEDIRDRLRSKLMRAVLSFEV